MHHSIVISIAALIAVTPAATASSVRFELPAQFEGEATVHKGVRILLFSLHPADLATFVVDAVNQSEWANRTLTIGKAEHTAIGGGSTPWLEQTESGAAPEAFNMSFGTRGPASLYIEAEAIQITGDLGGVLVPRRTEASYADLTPGISQDQFIYRPHPFDLGDAFVQILPSGLLEITASNVRFMEWFNAEPRCESVACPPGGGSSRRSSGQIIPDTQVSLESYSHVSLEPSGAKVAGTGTFALAILSGPSVHITNDGRTRLPRATISDCQRCSLDADETLTLEGRVELGNLEFEGADAMRGDVAANITAARWDEKVVAPSELGITSLAITGPAGAAVVGSLVVGVKLLLAGLFTRRKKDPLQHPRRKAIHDYVVAHPGATFREVAREVRLPAGTARHHLSSLKRAGLLVEHPFHASVRFFENHGKYAKTWRETTVRRDPALAELEAWLNAHPGAAQKDILDAMEQANGWSRSTTQHRLARLVAEGLVHATASGRRLHYQVGQGPATVAVPGQKSPVAAASPMVG